MDAENFTPDQYDRYGHLSHHVGAFLKMTYLKGGLKIFLPNDKPRRQHLSGVMALLYSILLNVLSLKYLFGKLFLRAMGNPKLRALCEFILHKIYGPHLAELLLTVSAFIMVVILVIQNHGLGVVTVILFTGNIFIAF
jgi:hypothetical protein